MAEAETQTKLEDWFTSNEGPIGWRLDVVTLLAVIGESSIAEHAQAMTASAACLLPRLIPAPQALIKGSRPGRMPETKARVTGVYSGVTLDTVGFFANIMHPLDDVKPFAFTMLDITHVDDDDDDVVVAARPAHVAGWRRLLPGAWGRRRRRPHEAKDDAESQARTSAVALKNLGGDGGDDEDGAPPQPGIRRRVTVKDRMTDLIANPTLARSGKRPAIPAALYSPVHILSLLSMLLSLAIIGMAVYWQDGTAIVAVTLISLASSIVGAASWWRPILMNRSHRSQVPAGDVVIRTREGAFFYVRCTEEVARELYLGTEECEYRVGDRTYRGLMGAGTLLLMISVILLGNCSWNSQLFVGAAYVVLNALYWAMGLLPRRLFWDMSRYRCVKVTPDDAAHADLTTTPPPTAAPEGGAAPAAAAAAVAGNDKNNNKISNHDEEEVDTRETTKSFTRTLWYVIRETKRTAWVERSGAAPPTPQWRQWLAEAEAAAHANHRCWGAVARKDEIMRMSDADIAQLKEKAQQPPPPPQQQRQHATATAAGPGPGGPANRDPASQAAPAVEVQGQPSMLREPGSF